MLKSRGRSEARRNQISVALEPDTDDIEVLISDVELNEEEVK